MKEALPTFSSVPTVDCSRPVTSSRNRRLEVGRLARQDPGHAAGSTRPRSSTRIAATPRSQRDPRRPPRWAASKKQSPMVTMQGRARGDRDLALKTLARIRLPASGCVRVVRHGTLTSVITDVNPHLGGLAPGPRRGGQQDLGERKHPESPRLETRALSDTARFRPLYAYSLSRTGAGDRRHGPTLPMNCSQSCPRIAETCGRLSHGRAPIELSASEQEVRCAPRLSPASRRANRRVGRGALLALSIATSMIATSIQSWRPPRRGGEHAQLCGCTLAVVHGPGVPHSDTAFLHLRRGSMCRGRAGAPPPRQSRYAPVVVEDHVRVGRQRKREAGGSGRSKSTRFRRTQAAPACGCGDTSTFCARAVSARSSSRPSRSPPSLSRWRSSTRPRTR